MAWALLSPPPAWRQKASVPSHPPFYDEDGIYLDSLSAPGRGRGPARLAWAVASVTAEAVSDTVVVTVFPSASEDVPSAFVAETSLSNWSSLALAIKGVGEM